MARRPVPIVDINIRELNDTGILHKAAKESFVSPSLYNELLLKDVRFINIHKTSYQGHSK